MGTLDDIAAPPKPRRRPSGNRASGAAARSTQVIESKLTPPASRPGQVERHRLLDRLVTPHHERIVGIFAPPGYGKTTLLTQWIGRERRPVAWLTVDEADADPGRLLLYVATAIERAVSLDPSVLEVLGSTSSVIDIGVPRLAVDVQGRDEPFLLVLDDVHTLTGQASIDALAMLMDYLPPWAEVVLCGRANPGLPLARHRSRGAILDVTEADLALTVAESRQLARVSAPDLSDADARVLHDRTEGWPAAIYLATRRGSGTSSRTPPAASAAGEGDIRDWLEAEMLRNVGDDDRSFLVQSSVVDPMNAGVCDAVTGRTDSRTRLPRLAADHRLVQPLDVDTYRCHTLLRQHLRSLLEHEGWDARVLHRRAAAWYVENDDPEAAIDHLLAAGDRDAAARLITPIAFRLFREARWSTVERWLAAIGDDLLREHPYLAALAAWTHLLHGRAAEAERMLLLIESAGYGARRPAGAEPFEAVRTVAQAVIARDGLDVALRSVEAAATGEPADSPWRPASLVVYGMVLAIAGQRSAANAILDEAAELALAEGAARTRVAALAWSAMLAAETEDWDRAIALGRSSLAFLDTYGHETDVIVANATVVAARAAILVHDVQAARRHLASFQVARGALGIAAPWMSVRCLLEAARVYLAISDPAGARNVLRQADDLLARSSRNLGSLPAETAALHERVRGLPTGPGGASTLTPAEIRVLRLMPTYLTVVEIADRLSVSTNTVRTQVRSIYGKLDATSRGELVERAIEAGLLEPLPTNFRAEFTRS
jgi:LuxR family transcriptional regulator, maltose regulon positive regulatory protein